MQKAEINVPLLPPTLTGTWEVQTPKILCKLGLFWDPRGWGIFTGHYTAGWKFAAAFPPREILVLSKPKAKQFK